jgi:hypothetical protein
VLALTCYGASPLAGLFLGIVLVAVGITDRARRRLAVCAGSTVLLVAGSMAIIFPGTGTMPFAFADTVPPGLGCIAVLLVCRNSVIRWTTAIVLLSFPILLVYPGAIGGNITRFGWVCAAPIVIGYARLPRRALALTTLALMLWPLGDLAGQLTSSANPSAQAAYYAPLSSQLNRYLASGGSAGIGQRVELVDTKNHWGSVYLADLSLARGWDRQADVANNPIFYHSGALTAASYRAWLDSLAVALVAVPAAPLDYASIDEAALIGRGLDYLKPVWSSSTWKLYRVVDPTPLVSGATIRSVSSTGVVLTGPRDSPIAVRVRWSPYIVARDTTTGMATPACVSDVDGWVGLVLPRAETVTLSAKLDPKLRLTSPDPDCVADLLKG